MKVFRKMQGSGLTRLCASSPQDVQTAMK